MEIDKEQLAVRLAKRAETAVKILKILVCAALVILGAAVVYSIIAFTVADRQTAVIGLIVFMACLVILAVAVISVLAYAYYNLYKLKKIK